MVCVGGWEETLGIIGLFQTVANCSPAQYFYASTIDPHFPFTAYSSHNTFLQPFLPSLDIFTSVVFFPLPLSHQISSSSNFFAARSLLSFHHTFFYLFYFSN